MPLERPNFEAFTRWLAETSAGRVTTKLNPPSLTDPGALGDERRYQRLLTAARAARDEVLRATTNTEKVEPAEPSREHSQLEVLQLLAAADRSESSRPPELVTASGFRVMLAYDEGNAVDASSICVLVRCPPELISALQGKSAYLWNGTERFEVGQFDPDGKAIGTLPAGIEVSLSDFALGKVKLEEPPPTDS
jgi:hypothetical protein